METCWHCLHKALFGGQRMRSGFNQDDTVRIQSRAYSQDYTMRTRSLKIDNIVARQVILMMEVAMTGGNDGNIP